MSEPDDIPGIIRHLGQIRDRMLIRGDYVTNEWADVCDASAIADAIRLITPAPPEPRSARFPEEVLVAYLSNIVTKIERDGEWVLTRGDVGLLQNAVKLLTKRKPTP